MKKTFVVRDRSLTSFPSRNSMSQFNISKQALLPQLQSKMSYESRALMQKQEDISKLKGNLEYALNMAINEAKQTSRAKHESMVSYKSKSLIQKKYLQASEQLTNQKMLRMKMQAQILELQHELEREISQKKILETRQVQLLKEHDKTKKQLTKIPLLEQKNGQIEPLRLRVKSLEVQLRDDKLKNQQMAIKNKKLQKQILALEEKLKKAKPLQQELSQRIALLERVNLELQRKMQDFHRRQSDYKKQIQAIKTTLAKTCEEKNFYREKYQTTSATLQQKLKVIEQLQNSVACKISQIHSLSSELEEKNIRAAELQKKLAETIEYYRSVGEENQYLKKRNLALQQNQDEIRKTIDRHMLIAEETNSYIIERNCEVNKLEEIKKSLEQNLEELQKKFEKFDKLFAQGEARGENQIKQSYYRMLREKDKLALELKETQEEMAFKIMKYGEQRDEMTRKINAYEVPTPNDENLFQSIILDKTSVILLLESSNDQLIKIKKQQSERIVQLEKQAENLKKEMFTLRLKAAELFKIKKELQQCKSKNQRYIQMIEQQKVQASDLNSQLEVLRLSNSEIAEKMFTIDLDNKNLQVKLSSYETLMKQLDIEYLNRKKAQNEKNAHMIADSVEKLTSAVNALKYLFSCCYCDQLALNPVTLAPCGHNYCPKCKDAYAEYCYECDTGQNIDKVYSSKFLKEMVGKYSFLLMVVGETRSNMEKFFEQAKQ